jgi:16S rRNA (uracil1498-N3)-methyltransferase
MHRFFVDKENISENYITMTGEDVKHIKNVLRAKIGDKLSICDGDETDYVAKVEEIEKDEVVLSIIETFSSKGEPPITLKIYQGLPKADKMELIVQKCTELGVSEIVPIITNRAVVKLSDQKKTEKKLERWSKIAYEAAKQSKRGRVPKVNKLLSLKEAVREIDKEELVLLLYEAENQNSLKPLLKEFSGKNISVFIGPEGGFDETEVDLLREADVNIVSLGNRILRTETAGLAVCSIVMYELGDLGVI